MMWLINDTMKTNKPVSSDRRTSEISRRQLVEGSLVWWPKPLQINTPRQSWWRQHQAEEMFISRRSQRGGQSVCMRTTTQERFISRESWRTKMHRNGLKTRYVVDRQIPELSPKELSPTDSHRGLHNWSQNSLTVFQKNGGTWQMFRAPVSKRVRVQEFSLRFSWNVLHVNQLGSLTLPEPDWTDSRRFISL